MAGATLIGVDTPAERAIAAFERLHRLTVTVHDLRGDLWHHVVPERLAHRHPLCRAVKHHPLAGRCEAFELEHLRAQLARSGTGRVHVCHAGLVEWVVPVRSERGLDWILFAGPRRAGQLAAVRDTQPATTGVWPAKTTLPPIVDDAEAADLLEALYALAARLDHLRRERPRTERSVRLHVAGDGEAHRAARIARFIAQHHARDVSLEDLAVELDLTADRSGREVRRLLGRGFPALLTEARLNAAATLLRTTALSVLDIGLQSGFSDASHFHACFRRRFGATPAAWRSAT